MCGWGVGRGSSRLSSPLASTALPTEAVDGPGDYRVTVTDGGIFMIRRITTARADGCEVYLRALANSACPQPSELSAKKLSVWEENNGQALLVNLTA